MQIYNAFLRAKDQPATYRIRGVFKSASGINQATQVTISALKTWPFNFSTQFVFLVTQGAQAPGIIGIDETVVVPQEYIHMTVATTFPLTLGTINVRDLRIEYVAKAEVQDTDIASRRNILYEGTKMSSTDINVDSPDTIDGGPVITVNTVGSSSPSSNPIGTSVIGPAVTMTQQQQTGQA